MPRYNMIQFQIKFFKKCENVQIFWNRTRQIEKCAHTQRESLVKERFIPYKVMFNWSRTFRDGLSLRVSVADEISTKKK